MRKSHAPWLLIHVQYYPHGCPAVLKGIEDFKLRGKQGAEMVQKVEELTKKHLQVRSSSHNIADFSASYPTPIPSLPHAQ